MKYLIWVIMLVIFGSCMKETKEVFTTADGAINGYDPVSYFSEGGPSKGSPEFTAEWNGATWYFSNAYNKMLFDETPEKFAPQYGGYCAFGTADGHKAPTQPDAWTIVGGKLYLNYNKEVMGEWRKDTTGFIDKADANWPEVKRQP